MKQQLMCRKWARPSILLLIVIFTFTGSIHAQSKFRTIFGLGGCSNDNKLNCMLPAAANSFTAVPMLHDGTPGSTVVDYFKNATYDGVGNLLFSVNANGIWAPDATCTMVDNFSNSLSFPCSGGPRVYSPTNAISEIVTVPVPSQPSSYYVIFWSYAFSSRLPYYYPVIFRAVRVDITSNFGNTSVSTYSWYNFTDYVLNPPSSVDCSDNFFWDYGPSAFEVVADAPNADCSRDIYTSNTDIIGGSYSTSVRKWTIAADGSFPGTVPSPINTAGTLLNSYATKAKLLKVLRPGTTNTFDKMFCYVGQSSITTGPFLQTYDLTTGLYHTYKAPNLTGFADKQDIWGFEYLPTQNLFCITFEDFGLFESTGVVTDIKGGFASATPATGTSVTTFSYVSGSSPNFCFSDLELDAHGDMYMVNQDLTTGLGTLYYVSGGDVTTTTPVQSTSSCTSGTLPVSVNNFQTKYTNPAAGDGWYLGTQIRGEDYMAWGDVTYEVTGSETWTSSSNPSGRSATTINMGNIIVDAGASLTISGITIQMAPGTGITVAKAPTSTGTGGYLALDHATLTVNNVCASTGNTWSGITLQSDPTYPQWLAWGVSQPQSSLYMNYSTISYADVGVQNGDMSGTQGGGLIAMPNGNNTFYNNQLAIQLWPYHNYAYGTTEANSFEWIRGCTFNTDASVWFMVTSYITLGDIKGVTIQQNNFENNTGSPITYAICADWASMLVEQNTFGSSSVAHNFTKAVSNVYVRGTYSDRIVNNTFYNNQWGLVELGGMATVVSGNTFNIPAYTGTTVYYYDAPSVLMINTQSIGALMEGSMGYNITNNIFQTAATGTSYYPYTSGTLEFNTGSDNNQVTDNTFVGLGVAMNSNYVNNTGAGAESGLQYLCNSDSHVGTDIAVLGRIPADGGINPTQATTLGTVPYNLPAGNIFSSSRNINDLQNNIVYVWYSGAANQDPVFRTSIVTATAIASAGNCYDVVDGIGPYSINVAPGYSISGNPYSTSTANRTTDPTLAYAIATANVNYYMMDADTISHRDSLYYWATKMNTAYGDLLIANLLIEDSLIDTANQVYDSIVSKYSLTGQEANDFVQGRHLMDILIAKRADHSSALSLAASQISTLQAVKANATMWAHARAEGWLLAVTGEELVDTLLYPADTTLDSSGGGGGKFGQNNNGSTLTKTSNTIDMVFPNPVHDLLQVVYTAKFDEAVKIQIEDISGRSMITQSLQNGAQTQIDVSKLVPGVYIYRIMEGSKVTMIGKVTKD